MSKPVRGVRGQVACPVCSRPVPAPPRDTQLTQGEQEVVFPFCSARCRTTDLGNWLGEHYRVQSLAALLAVGIALAATPVMAQSTDVAAEAPAVTTLDAPQAPAVIVVPDVAEPGEEVPAPETGDPHATPAVDNTGAAAAGAAVVAAGSVGGPSPFYLTAGAGLSYLEGVLFSEENFVPELDRLNGDGPSVAAAAGVQFLIFQLGGRFGYAFLEALDLGTVGGEFAVRLPIPVIEPYVRAGAGYVWTSDNGVLNTSLSRPGGARIDGFYLEAGVGLDAYLTSFFAIGASLDGVFMNLTRKGLSDCGGVSCVVGSVDLSESGDALGLMLRGLVNARLEFP